MSGNVHLSESKWDRAKTLALSAAAITITLFVATVALSTAALAQQSSYNYGYFVNANTSGFPDADMYVVNPGSTGGKSPTGDLCANIYVFSPAQVIQECCSCKVTPDALTTFSLNTNLTNDPLQAATLHTGAIKVVSSAVPASATAATTCKNVAASSYTPSGYLGIWITHVHVANGTYSKSETSFLPGILSTPNTPAANTELAQLQTLCSLILAQGSGFGICTCPSE